MPRVAGLEERALLSTITVTNDGDSGQGSLRQALQSAVAGETINFARSAYGTITLTSGALEVATGVTINGPGANRVTINGNNTYQDLLIDAGVTARVSGLTITGGTDPASGTGGGGIVNNGTLTVANCSITGNSALDGTGGGGIVNNGTLTVANCSITNNSAPDGSGGGINNNGSGTVTVTGSTIANNSAPTGGGGGIANGSGTLRVTSSVVSNNTASQGGGVDVFEGNLNVVNSLFLGNTAVGLSAYGGAIHTDAFTTVNVTGTSFFANTSIGDGYAEGGALDINQPNQATISRSWFDGNGAVVPSTTSTLGSGAEGGALFVAGGPVTIDNSIFSDNQAVGGPGGGLASGGAIEYQGPSTFDLSNSLLMNNNAIGGPDGGWGFGGALATSFGGTVTVANIGFVGNQAIGGAASQAGNQGGDGLGGAIQNASSTLTLADCILLFNSAEGGAGTDGATGGDGLGGGIQNQGTLTVTSSGIIGNEAIGGAGGGNGYGGGVYTAFGTTTLTNSLVTWNQADGDSDGGQGLGGGLYTDSATTTLTGNTAVAGNVATTSGNDSYTAIFVVG